MRKDIERKLEVHPRHFAGGVYMHPIDGFGERELNGLLHWGLPELGILNMSESGCTLSPCAVDALEAPAANASPARPASLTRAESELVLIRGLPGSGKSTMAAVLAQVGYKHLEADMFFMDEGVYRFNPMRVRDAHAWCQIEARRALENGGRVVVSNTFTRRDEMAPCLAVTTNVRIIEAKGNWANVHGVPAATLARMAERWEA